jgi:hypothetical protein
MERRESKRRENGSERRDRGVGPAPAIAAVDACVEPGPVPDQRDYRRRLDREIGRSQRPTKSFLRDAATCQTRSSPPHNRLTRKKFACRRRQKPMVRRYNRCRGISCRGIKWEAEQMGRKSSGTESPNTRLRPFACLRIAKRRYFAADSAR